ncbi:MAG: hypothetical protein KDD69_02290 [Bdellovibrionales bacterium]|nr:hypothetical protein [Bdellovibrionales bacterium]
MSIHATVLWNPSAGSATQAATAREIIEQRNDLELLECSSWEALVSCAAEAARRSEVLIAAGGDGTVNAVANGILQGNPSCPLLILPVGTGNDLARSLDVAADPVAALAMLEEPTIAQIDTIRYRTNQGSNRFFNMGTGGLSGSVIRNVDADTKRFWGPFAYFAEAAHQLREMESYEVCISIDQGPPVGYRIVNFLVANGTTTAGGLRVAPNALLDDGFMEVILVLESSLADLAVLASKLLVGEHLDAERVVHLRAKQLQLEGAAIMSADGDIIADSGPIFLELDERALSVLVGPQSSLVEST